MNKFLTSNKASFRLARTVVQAVLGWFIDNIAMIVAQTQFSADTQIVIVSLCMMILSAVMKALGIEDEKVRDNA